MNLAAALKSAKSNLTSTPTPKETTTSTQSIQQRRNFSLQSGSPDEILKYQKYIILFNLEAWLDLLGDSTFSTQYVPLNRQEAQHLASAYENRAATHQAVDPNLKTLQNKLQIVMDSVAPSGDGCFVKTSSRSAKDYADLNKLRTTYNQALSHLHSDISENAHLHHNDISENAKMIAMSYASMQLLRMPDAASTLVVLQNSERIWHDMKLALSAQGGGSDVLTSNEHGEEKIEWQESLVAREWVVVEPDMEFRCFITSGKLVAISQYRHLVYFPRLVANWSMIQQALLQSFDAIHSKLAGTFPKDDYILDLAIQLNSNYGPESILKETPLPPEAVTKVWVVEVNPFFETTDGCLFSWQRDKDVLLGCGSNSDASAPGSVAYRLREKPAKGCSSLVYGPWQKVLRNEPFDDAVVVASLADAKT